MSPNQRYFLEFVQVLQERVLVIIASRLAGPFGLANRRLWREQQNLGRASTLSGIEDYGGPRKHRSDRLAPRSRNSDPSRAGHDEGCLLTSCNESIQRGDSAC